MHLHFPLVKHAYHDLQSHHLALLYVFLAFDPMLPFESLQNGTKFTFDCLLPSLVQLLLEVRLQRLVEGPTFACTLQDLDLVETRRLIARQNVGQIEELQIFIQFLVQYVWQISDGLCRRFPVKQTNLELDKGREIGIVSPTYRASVWFDP